MSLAPRLFAYFRPSWRKGLLALLFMGLYALFDGVSLLLLIPFLNVLFGRGLPPLSTASSGVEEVLHDLFTHWLAAATPLGTLGRISGILLLLFFFKNLFRYLQAIFTVTIEQSIARDLRNQLYAHLHRLSLSFFHRTKTGQLLSRSATDVELVRRMLSEAVTRGLRNTLIVLANLLVLVWISWELTLVAVLVAPVMAYLIGALGRRLRQGSREVLFRLGEIASVFQETIAGIRVVKAFAMEPFELEKFRRANRAYFKSFIRMERWGQLAPPLMELLLAVATVSVLWYGGRLILVSGTLSPETFFVFLAAAIRLNNPLRAFGDLNPTLQQGMAAAERLFSILDTEPEVEERPGAIPVQAFTREIQFDRIWFAYRREKPVLQEVDLTIRKGQVVAVVGPSGAGKTTLVDLLARFYDPTRGRILLDGQDLRDFQLASLRQLMGMVTQEPILFNDTVRNNIAYGLEALPLPQVMEAARLANAHEFILQLSQGYETVLGERGVRLSGGQRQRIAIARAVLKNPPILIFDEATSSLDAESEYLVQQAIGRLMRDRTAIVIAHRLSTIQRADRIVVLDEGRVVEEGSHEALLKRGGLYTRLYQRQFEVAGVSEAGSAWE